MKQEYSMKQLLRLRKEHCWLCFTNALTGNDSAADYELDVLNTIQNEFLEQNEFVSIGDFLLRYNPVSKKISEKAGLSELEETLLNDLSMTVRENKPIDEVSFKCVLRQYKSFLEPYTPDAESVYTCEMIINRLILLFKDTRKNEMTEQEQIRFTNLHNNLLQKHLID